MIVDVHNHYHKVSLVLKLVESRVERWVGEEHDLRGIGQECFSRSNLNLIRIIYRESM